MAVPKLFYFRNSGNGQFNYLMRTRVRPCNWMQDSSMDDIRDATAYCGVTGLGEIEGVTIEGYYCICSRSGCFCGPSNRLWEKVMLCMSTTTLQSSLSVGRLTEITNFSFYLEFWRYYLHSLYSALRILFQSSGFSVNCLHIYLKLGFLLAT